MILRMLCRATLRRERSVDGQILQGKGEKSSGQFVEYDHCDVQAGTLRDIAVVHECAILVRVVS